MKPLTLENCQHVEVFDSITSMLRGFAEFTTGGDPTALAALDQRTQTGAVVRMTVSIGSAGPLGLLLQIVDQDGSTLDLLMIDAPPSAAPFRFAS